MQKSMYSLTMKTETKYATESQVMGCHNTPLYKVYDNLLNNEGQE